MADARKEPTSPEFLEHFASIADPRQAGKVLYPLNEIFLLVLCAVISGADGWTSIALYGRKKICKHAPRAVWMGWVLIGYEVSLWTHTRTLPAYKYYRFPTRVVDAVGRMMSKRPVSPL